MDSQKQEAFVAELASLINKYSLENESDTPDFILAEYLVGCLKCYGETVKKRDSWFGVSAGNTKIEEEDFYFGTISSLDSENSSISYQNFTYNPSLSYMLVEAEIKKGNFSGERHVKIPRLNNVEFVASVGVCYKNRDISPLMETDEWEGKGRVFLCCVGGYFMLPDGRKVKNNF